MHSRSPLTLFFLSSVHPPPKMKSMVSIRSSIILISLILLLTISSRISAESCIDHPDPFNPANDVHFDCNTVTEQRSAFKRDENNNNDETGNIFQVAEFRCDSNVTGLCDNVKEAFVAAGQIISEVFCLKTKILLNVTFADFCEALGICPGSQFVAIGAARPSRSMLLQDDDGTTRFYPQALVKQFQLSTRPDYAPYDIVASFNSQVQWWFRQYNRTISGKERDFEFIVLHELMHGLGFYSFWQNFIPPANSSTGLLTPYPIFSNDPLGNGIIFDGFQEYCWDKYIVMLPSGERLSDVNKQLNKFAGGPGTKFANQTDFILQFFKSPQYNIAAEIYQKSMIANDLGFLPQGVSDLSDAVTLETSINPYTQGSSIDHVSLQRYQNSSDFLMKYLFYPQETLENLEQRGGSGSFGPIGPELRLIMVSLGYKLFTGSNPTIPNPTLPSNPPYPMTYTIDD